MPNSRVLPIRLPAAGGSSGSFPSRREPGSCEPNLEAGQSLDIL
jgi:hypothetical protein